MKIKEHVKLAKYTTIGIGGTAAYFLEVEAQEDLQNAISFSKSVSLPYFVLGGGSNLLIDDGTLNTVILKPVFNEIFINDTIVEVGASFKLPRLVNILLKEELSGLEELAEIPGEVGGAVFMNAGSFGREIGEVIEHIDVFDGSKILRLGHNELKFSYRHSGIKLGWIITKIALRLTRGNKFRMTKLIADVKRKRREAQPVGKRTFGSVFKNPEGTGAGYLIERAGLKGYRINDAEISKKHANFIINRGNARFNDVLQLINHARNTVIEKFGIPLEEEVVMLKGGQNG